MQPLDSRKSRFSTVRSDAARLVPLGGLNYKWVNLGSTGPPRWRHSIVYDPGPAGSPADSARILVFGGRESASTLADNAVWAGRLTNPIQWYVAVGPNSDPNVAPAARERHGAFFRAIVGVTGPMVIFGGLDGSNTLRNDAWVLERSANSFDYSWRKLNVGNSPSARMDFSMSYDPQRGILVVTGGDGNGEAPGGQLADVWGLPLDLCSTGGNPDWYQLPGMSALGARSGHASAFVALPPFSNRVIGRFSAAAAPGQQWKLLWWAPKLMPFTYPFMFVLQNGHVAWTGPNGSGWNGAPGISVNKTMILNPDSTATSSRGWQSSPYIWTNNGAWGGSAVVYHVAPDSVRVLRCGGHHGGPLIESDATRTDVIAFGPGGGSGGWARVAASGPGALTGRRDHNLIILPTGDVLVTGGKGPGQKARTQIWNPDTRLWSAELAEDPRIRNYHSSAALLPDGRVLSVGGHDTPTADKNDRAYATIYEPPYLFDGDSPSSRPQIMSALARATYQQIVTVCVNDEQAIDRVALLRPAATTHAFDQNQRYVPLSFVRASNPSRLLVTMPANANLAPPGDYLLFVCDVTGGRSIPSEGRWMGLHTPVGRDSCDTVAPAGGSWLSLQTEGCVPPSYGDIRLRWSVPADDATLAASGQVKDYDLRYVLNSGSPPPFESWTAWPTTVTQLPGGTEQIVINGLPNSWHRFALRPTDDNLNSSVLSNQVVARPLWCEDGFSGGSGGGGGNLMGEAAAMASIEGTSPAQAPAFRENSLLHGLALGERGRDRLRLAVHPSKHAGSWSVVLRQSGQSAVNLGHVRLLLADHAEGTEVVAGPAELLSGTLLPATRVLDGEARDRTAAARGEAPDPVHANADDVLDVELPEGDVLVLEAQASDDPESTGIVVEVPSGTGSWSAFTTLHPRRNADRVALEGVPARNIRLRFLGAHAISYVGRLSGATRLTAVEAVLTGSTSARQGDVLAALLAADPVTLSLDDADTVKLSFAATPTPAGMVRDFFLEVEGARVAKSGSRSARLADVGPARVTLLPSMPNPAQAISRLRFALPEPAWVALDVHDTQGRLVKRFSGSYGVGVHAVDWDLRDLAGRRVAPGIYIQRLRVGNSRTERSIVVLQ